MFQKAQITDPPGFSLPKRASMFSPGVRPESATEPGHGRPRTVSKDIPLGDFKSDHGYGATAQKDDPLVCRVIVAALWRGNFLSANNQGRPYVSGIYRQEHGESNRVEP